jgi:hypothetical protein
LSSNIPGNRRYLFHSDDLILGDDVANFIRQQFPQLRNRVPAGNTNPIVPENLLKTDISKSKKVFGNDWKNWKESLIPMVNDILQAEKDGRVEKN